MRRYNRRARVTRQYTTQRCRCCRVSRRLGGAQVSPTSVRSLLTWPLPCRCRSTRVYPHPSLATPPLVSYTRLPLHRRALFPIPPPQSLSRRVLHKRTPPLAAQPYFYLTHRTLFYSEMIWKRVTAFSRGKDCGDFMTKHVAATLAGCSPRNSIAERERGNHLS